MPADPPRPCWRQPPDPLSLLLLCTPPQQRRPEQRALTSEPLSVPLKLLLASGAALLLPVLWWLDSRSVLADSFALLPNGNRLLALLAVVVSTYLTNLYTLESAIVGASANLDTDTAAALRANEMNAEAILKATKVDGIYDSDPKKNPTAKRYTQVSYQEALTKQLKVMDAAAFALCMDNAMPIIVFDLFKPHNIKRVVLGEKVGTLVTN